MVLKNIVSDKSFVLIQLERKQKDIEQLCTILDSYLYAPKTPDLFEKRENLILELNQLAEDTKKLRSRLKSIENSNENYTRHISKNLEEYNEIHQEVAEYVNVARL